MKVLAKDLRCRQWFLRDGRKCEAAGMVTKSGECLHLSEGAIAWIDENCEVELIDPPAEPTYRPYTDAELLEQLGAKVRLKESQNVYILISVQGGLVETSDQVFAADLLLDEYEHLDGTACGVEE